MMLQAMQTHMPEAMPGQCDEQMHVRNGRTYVRTTHLCSYLTLSNARGGAAQNG